MIIPIRAALLLTLLLFGIGIPVPAASPTTSPLQEQADHFNPLPAQPQLRSWVEQLKQNPRGPFKRIRWFCNDGAVLPPKAYACRSHGGGVQHGDWIDRVKQLRQHNYLIGTLLADLLNDRFFARPNWSDQLKQILLEQFLRRPDNGWIFRQARFYRGAIQAEDENSHGRALLLGLLAQPGLSARHFLLLRTAVDLLPHGQESSPLRAMRQLAQSLAEQDAGFSALRIKLHSQPTPADAYRVRDYAKTSAPELHENLQQLARLIDAVTRPQGDPFNEAISLQLLNDTPANQGREMHPADDFSRASQLLLKIRTELPTLDSASRQLAWLDLSKRLESSLYRSANQLLKRLPTANRRQRLLWIKQGVDALYGTGMLSQRERQSLQHSLQLLHTTPVPLTAYQREITQLTRAGRWAENRLRYYFAVPLKRLTRLEPLAQTFVPEQLRGSPLLAISTIIDSLQRDSQRLRGVSHQLFGAEVSGLTPLNPGLAQGRLEIVQEPHRHDYSAAGIYLLPQTVEDLPPVAGILTLGAGNSLSHIQLLARNLGIPNIAIDARLQARISTHQGEIVRLAVSPGGNIKIETEQNQAPLPEATKSPAELMIAPAAQKLALERTAIIELEQLRATDSGRIVGPKGANLGELKQFYPQLVPDALVIPFGRFRRFLEQTPAVGGQNLFAWMRSNYQRLAKEPDEVAQKKFLTLLREKIAVAPMDRAFRHQLREALNERFGPDGSYGIFVRSDTNVEDLPNFSG
ncbi:MAG: hypothetical protein L3J63_12540, partial [Geopsychrobacter sp.]|nr:hypothetical protein [Geopsychrobacter sp.]